ncbi:MAG TPA: DMT family transporter [Burkholderiales bacterium]
MQLRRGGFPENVVFVIRAYRRRPAPPCEKIAALLPSSATLLAWYFVAIWGSGFLATKVGLHYAAPFTFLALRYAFGLICLAPVLLWMRPAWPRSPREIFHILVAGLLMHAVQLGGSHYAQYLGLSAGVTALTMAAQPLLTATIAWRWMGERLSRRQWTGVLVGLAGVALVIWHKIDVHVLTAGGLAAVATGLTGVTAGTLYQRAFCRHVNLWSGAFLQFAISFAVLAPLALRFEGARIDWSWQLAASIAFLVIFASIFAVNALHTLMRRGQATRVTSLMYLTPIIAVVLEFLMFGERPSALTMAGVAVTCFGVALVSAPRRSNAVLRKA